MSANIKHIVDKLLNYFKFQELKASDAEKNEIWRNIKSAIAEQEQRKKKNQYRLYVYFSAAAIFLLLILVPLYYFDSNENPEYLANFANQTTFNPDSLDGQIKLILSDEEERFVNNEASITYSESGAIAVNQDTIIKKQTESKQKKELVPNQIIIPKGKRSKLTLADGSKLWINSGSRVIYPPVFEKDKREIYIEGEVYLEVARDENCPFFVKTKDFNVEVLGTKFNVSAYLEDKTAEVVLVDGSVEVNTSNYKTVKLSPDQMIDITNGKMSNPVKVDSRQYVSWIDNMLIYEDEPLSRVCRKLNLYYGVNIEYAPEVSGILVSGKLDLKENLEDVLHTISYTAPVRFEYQDNNIKAFIVDE